MQIILQVDEKSLSRLVGRYLVEVNDDDFRSSILEDGDITFFHVEKRVSSIVDIGDGEYILAGVYYPHSKRLISKDMISRINKPTKGRHMRLMSVAEITALHRWVEENK